MSPETPFEQLSKLVGSAYSRPNLERFVREKLNSEFYDYTPRNENDPNTISILLDNLSRAGRLTEFVQAFKTDKPQRPDIQRFCDDFLAHPPQFAAGPPSPLSQIAAPARDKVVRFNERFQRCRDEIRYLSGYKELHDVLHELQSQLDVVGQATTRFRAQPNDRGELLGIAVGLQELVQTAQAGANKLLDPDDVADWLKPFEEAVANLEIAVRTPDLKLLGQVEDLLARLPSEQAEINEELVKAAKRIGVEGLIGLMDGILADLGSPGAVPTGLVSGFQGGLERFRGLCAQLTSLRFDHNSCQHVENALALAATLTVITPEQITGWQDVKQRIKDLALRRPNDPLAARIAASVDRFEASGPAAEEEFATLLVRFRILFNRTDKDLMAVTDNLVREAELLDAQLRTLTNVNNC